MLRSGAVLAAVLTAWLALGALPGSAAFNMLMGTLGVRRASRHAPALLAQKSTGPPVAAARDPDPQPAGLSTSHEQEWTVRDAIRVPWSRSGTSDEREGAGAAGFLAPPMGRGRPGLALDIDKLSIKWKAGERGSQMQKGGFGYVYFGTYDASEFAGPAHTSVKVVVKLPSDDADAVNAFEREGQINARIASFGGMPGVAEFLGSVDLSGVDASQLPAGVGGDTALVWRAVPGKTLDTYWNRQGGMSPMLAKTLDVQASAPVTLPSGELSYIKVDLATKVMGESLVALRALHALGVIHRDFKPQNLMLAENELQAPLRVIDMGSALLPGQSILMEDFTEIYAPPEAPEPDAEHPEAYDVYSVGVIGLRCLMPALVAGEAGVQTLGRVACAELPSCDYDFRAWCRGRAEDMAAAAQDMPLNAECLALMQVPHLFELFGDMLARDPACRPSAEACVERLGGVWLERLEGAGRYPIGVEIPLLWQEGVEWVGGGGGGGGFEVGEACVVRRSDGRLKFGQVKAVGAGGGYDVMVEPCVGASKGAFQKNVPAEALGRLCP